MSGSNPLAVECCSDRNQQGVVCAVDKVSGLLIDHRPSVPMLSQAAGKAAV